MRNRLAGTLLLLFVFLCTSWAQTSGLRKMIDLSGTWSFALDPHGKGEQEKLWNMDFAETVTLPGTTDSNRKGIENTNKSETTYLSRYYKYEGAAWYSRNIEIPADWKEKHIVLFLERTRPTTVWIDGREVGKCNYLSTPRKKYSRADSFKFSRLYGIYPDKLERYYRTDGIAGNESIVY